MALPKTIEDRNYQNYVECNGLPTRLVKICQAIGEAIKVEVVTDVSGDSINIYSESFAVAGNSSTDIVSYTVPIGKYFVVKRFDYSGTNRAVYQVEVNASTIAKKRAYLVDYNGEFIFDSLKLSEGDNIKLVVENSSLTIADFNCNLQGKLFDA